MHRDLVKLEWSMGQQVLMERMEVDDPRVVGPLGVRWAQAVDHTATYVDISEPHSEADCPFKATDRVSM